MNCLFLSLVSQFLLEKLALDSANIISSKEDALAALEASVVKQIRIKRSVVVFVLFCSYWKVGFAAEDIPLAASTFVETTKHLRSIHRIVRGDVLREVRPQIQTLLASGKPSDIEKAFQVAKIAQYKLLPDPTLGQLIENAILRSLNYRAYHSQAPDPEQGMDFQLTRSPKIIGFFDFGGFNSNGPIGAIRLQMPKAMFRSALRYAIELHERMHMILFILMLKEHGGTIESSDELFKMMRMQRAFAPIRHQHELTAMSMDWEFLNLMGSNLRANELQKLADSDVTPKSLDIYSRMLRDSELPLRAYLSSQAKARGYTLTAIRRDAEINILWRSEIHPSDVYWSTRALGGQRGYKGFSAFQVRCHTLF